MNQSLSAWGHLEKLVWGDVLIIAAALFVARLLILAMEWTFRHAAETARPHRRLTILRIVPRKARGTSWSSPASINMTDAVLICDARISSSTFRPAVGPSFSLRLIRATSGLYLRTA